MLGSTGGDQSLAFKKLKPACVHAIQVIVSFQNGQCNGLTVSESIESLLTLLNSTGELSPKLADYCFFPLSHLFRSNACIPERATRAAVQCTSLLVVKGWKNSRSSDLSRELLVLLNLLLQGGANNATENGGLSDEIVESTLECARQVLTALITSIQMFCSRNPQAAFTILGKLTSSIIIRLSSSSSLHVQIMAVNALNTEAVCLQQVPFFRRFLPGIFSALSQVVRSSKIVHRHSSLLTTVLETLGVYIHLVSWDALRDSKPVLSIEPSPIPDKFAFLQENADQLKAILASALINKRHTKHDVRQSLFEFCISFARDISSIASDSRNMVLDGLLELCENGFLSTNLVRYNQFKDLLEMSKHLQAPMTDTLHHLLSNTRALFSKAEYFECEIHLGKILMSLRLLEETGLELSDLDAALLDGLLDATTEVLSDMSSTNIKQLNEAAVDIRSATESVELTVTEVHYVSTAPTLNSRDPRLTLLYQFIHQLLKDGFLSRFTNRAALKGLHNNDTKHLSSLWMVCSIYTICVDHPEIKQKMPSELTVIFVRCFDYLNNARYKDFNPILETISLDIVKIYAIWQGRAIEPDLADMLLPVLERVGSTSLSVQNSAVSCLKTICLSCGLPDLRSLIVQNADYLVNALSIKFNASSINYQSAQVMVMMLELCGPDIIPYFTDIIDSIMSLLDHYHGYPLLVGSLFAILESVVEQSSYLPVDVDRKDKAVLRSKKEGIEVSSIPSAVRKFCLSSNTETVSHLEFGRGTTSDESAPAQNPGTSIKLTTKPSKIKIPGSINTICQSIVRHAQYHLTSESAKIKSCLLRLMSMSFCRLSVDEDKFLPLVNDIWPIMSRRLYDKDANTKIAALEAMALLVKYSGDFMSSRIQDEWSRIKELITITFSELETRKRSASSRATFTDASRIWHALAVMLLQFVRYLHITSDMEDDMFSILVPHTSSKDTSILREILEILNPDAFWLYTEGLIVTIRTGELNKLRTPVAESGVQFLQL